MADKNMNTNSPNTGQSNSSNQTMQHERAKAEVGGNRQQEQGGSTGNIGERQQSGQFGKDQPERSAIGGGESRSETGEPGRARNELGEDKNRQFEKNETGGSSTSR